MGLHPSLPFGGGLAYSVPFWVVFAFWDGAELILNVRRRPAPRDKRDRGSFGVLCMAIGVAFVLDFAFALRLPGAAVGSAAQALFAAGLCSVLAGMWLRWHAVATLGRYFTVEVATQTTQPVIGVGPYRYIRHPAYTGTLLTLIGFALALGNWAGLMVMVALPGIAYGYRIRVEETALLATLGEPYARYMRHTWRLIPGLI